MEPKPQKECFASPELAAAALKSRYFRITLLLCFLRYFTILNFAAGACFLILRQIGHAGDIFSAVFLCGLATATGLAFVAARRQTSEQRGWLAAIDAHNGSGGLLMATEETGDTGWRDRLPGQVEIPVLKPAAGNRYMSAGLSLLFLLLSLTIPVVGRDTRNDPRIELRELERVAAGQIEILAEEGIISPEEARQLNESLERIGLDSQRHDPAATFEALDQLQEKLKKQAGASVVKNLSEQKNLDELAELAEKMGKAAGQNDDQISELARAVSKGLEEAAGDVGIGSGSEKLQRALEKAAAGGPDSAEAAREAAEALQEYIDEQQAKAAAAAAAAAQRLASARLIDRKTFESLKKAGKIRPATEADLQPGSQSELVTCEGGGSESGNGQQGEGQGDGQGDGVGGTQTGGQTGSGSENGSGASGQAGRGGGHAPLKFNRKSSEHNVEFKNEVLPAPDEQALEKSVAIGMSFSAPQTSAGSGDDGSQAGAAWQKTSEGSAESGIILPKHRSAVKKYFDHEQ